MKRYMNVTETSRGWKTHEEIAEGWTPFLDEAAEIASKSFPAKNRIFLYSYGPSVISFANFKIRGGSEWTNVVHIDIDDLLDGTVEEAADVIVAAFDELIESGTVKWRSGYDPRKQSYR